MVTVLGVIPLVCMLLPPAKVISPPVSVAGLFISVMKVVAPPPPAPEADIVTALGPFTILILLPAVRFAHTGWVPPPSKTCPLVPLLAKRLPGGIRFAQLLQYRSR